LFDSPDYLFVMTSKRVASILLISLMLLSTFGALLPKAKADAWTDITLPYTITQSGLYRVTANYTGVGVDNIILGIEANHVTVDFQHHGVTGSGQDAGEVCWASYQNDITILNGNWQNLNMGINISHGNLCNVTNCVCNNVMAAFFFGDNTNDTLQDSSATTGWSGVSANSAVNVTLSNDTFTDLIEPTEFRYATNVFLDHVTTRNSTQYEGFDCESVTNLVARFCYAYDAGTAEGTTVDGFDLANADGASLFNCYVNGASEFGLNDADASNVHIENFSAINTATWKICNIHVLNFTSTDAPEPNPVSGTYCSDNFESGTTNSSLWQMYNAAVENTVTIDGSYSLGVTGGSAGFYFGNLYTFWLGFKFRSDADFTTLYTPGNPMEQDVFNLDLYNLEVRLGYNGSYYGMIYAGNNQGSFTWNYQPNTTYTFVLYVSQPTGNCTVWMNGQEIFTMTNDVNIIANTRPESGIWLDDPNPSEELTVYDDVWASTTPQGFTPSASPTPTASRNGGGGGNDFSSPTALPNAGVPTPTPTPAPQFSFSRNWLFLGVVVLVILAFAAWAFKPSKSPKKRK